MDRLTHSPKQGLLLAVTLSCLLASTSAAPQAVEYAASGASACTFDYVVVGGGPGGLTIASRLSENPAVSVAIVEAGTFAEKVTGNQSQIPAFDFLYNGKSPSDTNPAVEWGFVTTPQAGIDGQSVHFPRGKGLGGSTLLNYMAYVHTTKGALQKWADVVGDSSYNYDTVSRLYRKSMNFYPPDASTRLANATPSYNAADASAGGPLDVGYAAFAQSWSTWVAKACQAVGITNTNAFLNGKLMGSSYLTATLERKTGFRESAERAFLRPYLNRPNLVVYNNTLGEKILFDKGKKATGVSVTRAKSTFTLNARREVIVSGGAFQSPQLLQVSGVGPASLLRQFNIPVVADLAGVGQGMNDHVFFGIAHRVKVTTTSSFQYGDNLAQAAIQFNTTGTGPLSSPGGDFAAYEKIPQNIRQKFAAASLTKLAALPADWPEVQILPLPAYSGDSISSSNGSPQDGYQYATLLASLVAPASRGTVNIASTRMSDQPLINPNWLTDQQDKDLVIGAFKRLREILASPAVTPVLIGPEYYPGSSVQTDAQILAYIKKSFNTLYHPTSTCKMGKKSDSLAVVDNKARVYGVKNLRVIDASAFPFLPPGLPMATVYMLAEKIAEDIIKGN